MEDRQMKSPLQHVRARLREILEETTTLRSFKEPTANQSERLEQLDAEAVALVSREQELEERAVRAEAASVVKFGTPSLSRMSTGDEYRDTALRNIESYRFISDENKHHAITKIDEARRDPACSGVSRIAAIRSDPTYASAFAKYLRSPMDAHLSWTPEEQRAWVRVQDEQRAMTAGTGSSGGYLVPLMLDPSFVITGTGARNPVREVARVKQIATLTYNGSTAAQITAGPRRERGILR
jgi:HK97 family phage major capsid protein